MKAQLRLLRYFSLIIMKLNSSYWVAYFQQGLTFSGSMARSRTSSMREEIKQQIIGITLYSKLPQKTSLAAAHILMANNLSQRLLAANVGQQLMKKSPKVILLGDTNVGKTSILQVLLHDSFSDKMANTLGACFHSYESEDSKGETIKMDIWDTAGQERFRSLLTLYYKNSDAVVIVFDVNDSNSFKTVDYWARQIENNCDSMPSIILVGNKVDLRAANKGVSKEEVSKYLLKRNKWQYIECSAKENFNIRHIFRVMGRLIREGEAEKEKIAQASKMKIHPSKLRKTNESTCC